MSKIAILFPGQGSQTNMMGKSIYDNNLEYKNHIDLAFKEFDKLKNVLYIMDNELINNTRYSQLAIFSNQVALFELVKPYLVNHEVAMSGFSLGEYSALCCSECFDYQTGLKIINVRSELMDTLNDSGVMYAAIGVEYDELSDIIKVINTACSVNIEIANSNTKTQQVLASSQEDFDCAMELLKDSKIKKLIKLKVSGAFHTSRFDNVANDFVSKLSNIKYELPKYKVYKNLDANIHDTSDLNVYFKDHMVNGVKFYQQILNMINDGYDTFIEISETSILNSMVKSIDRNVKLIHVKDLESLKQLEEL